MLDNYIINEETLLYFIARDLELQHLEAMGVDNWRGYGEGRKDFIKEVIKEKTKRTVKEKYLECIDFEDVAKLFLCDYDFIN